MKKDYLKAQIEIVEFDFNDVIVTSGEDETILIPPEEP